MQKPKTSAAIADLALIAVFLAVSLALIGPPVDFPLNDDWSFGFTVKDLVEQHRYTPLGWASMPLVTNVLWGSLFCLLFGFSFAVLHISTLVAAIIGLWAIYLSTRWLKSSRSVAIIVALTIAFNPVYYVLASTFMTDVLFATLLTLSAAFYSRALTDDSKRTLLFAVLFSTLATLSRQLAMALPLAYCLLSLNFRRISASNLIKSALPAAVAIVSLKAFEHWLSSTGRLPLLYSLKSDELIDNVVHPGQGLFVVAGSLFSIVLYLGLFLAPVSFWSAARSAHNKTFYISTVVAAFVLAASLVIRLLCKDKAIMPLVGNIMTRSGIGPLSLRGSYILHVGNPIELPMVFWLAATSIALVGASVTIGLIAEFFDERRLATKSGLIDKPKLFYLLSAAIYVSPLLLAAMFDRYLLPVVILIGIVLDSLTGPENGSLRNPPWRFGRGVAIGLLVISAWFAIAATHDYLSWNRLRWQAIADLQAKDHLTAHDLDGGFEFNAFYLYDPAYEKSEDKSWWWVDRDRFVIDFSPLAGYDVIEKYPFEWWLTRRPGEILVLQRK